MDQTTTTHVVPEAALTIDRASLEFLQNTLDERSALMGKVVIAKVKGVVVMGLGEAKSFHADIIDRATKEVLGESVLLDTDPNRPKIRENVVVEGARFAVSPDSVTIFHESLAFGPFTQRIFADPTQVVVRRFIEARVAEIRRQQSLSAPSDDLQLPPIPES
jgi:hypothetical protein